MSWNEKVHPELARRVTILLTNLGRLGLDVRVVQSLRSFAEQDALFHKRPKVTNARGGQSNHNYGLAVDLCPFVDNKPDWNDIGAFNVIGREAKKLGLEWGGDWKFVDKPHVQLSGLSIKECFVLYNKGGITRVWQRMYEILGGAELAVFTPAADDLIEFGDKGNAVRELQKQLVALNFLHAHEVDGEYDKITKNAVTGFQRQNKLTADGIVGAGTKAKLHTAVGELVGAVELTPQNVGARIDTLSAAPVAAENEAANPIGALQQSAEIPPPNAPEQAQEAAGNLMQNIEEPAGAQTTKTQETILQKVQQVGDKIQTTTEKITSVQNSFAPISRASWFMTLTVKLGGWLMLVLAFAKDNWLELVIAFGLIALAVFLYNSAKNRAVSKNSGK